jgi:uncharacterized protein YbjT (DUF2867 family)
MRVAIVGATGMLGQHTLAAAAAAGHDVVAIARSNSSLLRLRDGFRMAAKVISYRGRVG